MRYAQIKAGRRLHLVFEAENGVSKPICGRRVAGYRMTINVPLANACRSCLRIYAQTQGAKIRREFFEWMKEG